MTASIDRGAERAARRGMADGELIMLAAALLGLHSLGLDGILPGLSDIRRVFGVVSANSVQWVVSAYLFGFGGAQLLMGPLADRYGRRPVLLAGLAVYTMLTVAAGLAGSFAVLLVARAAQGAAASAFRVLAMTLIRDRFAGPTMARAMSLVTMVFLVAPILAPSLGQLILFVAPWRWIFAMLVATAAILFGWALLRLPETLPIDRRRPFTLSGVASGARFVVTHRASLGYTLAGTFSFGLLMAYVFSAQQLFADFGVTTAFPVLFATGAVAMGLSSLVNSRLVMRLGSHRIATMALCAITLLIVVHLGWLIIGPGYGLAVFLAMNVATMFLMGFTGPNYAALAMEAMGGLAGLATSVQGTIQTIGAAVIGTIVGQFYDGGPGPLLIAFLVLTLAQLAITRNLRPRAGA